MQRVFYAACPDPDKFWTLTFDEIILVIQGQIDKWRIDRINAYNIHRSLVDKPVTIYEFNPLPYDDELQESEEQNTMTSEEIYNLVVNSNKSIFGIN